jgi:hypothetical protein
MARPGKRFAGETSEIAATFRGHREGSVAEMVLRALELVDRGTS